jgi:hypothetical protein
MSGSEIENLKKIVLSIVDGAAKDTRASAATSAAQAATGASLAEVTEAVDEAATEIKAQTAVSRASTDHTSTSQDQRKPSHG